MFSDGMKRRRKLLGISQSALSRISGVPQSTISAVEIGSNIPTEETMKMIAVGLGCTVGDLMADEGEKETQPIVTDGLRLQAIARVSKLSDPALVRVLDFLSGLQAGQEIQAAEAAGPDPDDESSG